jgi:hypothetical protein
MGKVDTENPKFRTDLSVSLFSGEFCSVYVKRYNPARCFVWVCNLVADTEGGT